MIAGIGIDSVEIDRFTDWHTWPQEKLLRIFSQEEIDYCLSCSIKSAERFAARFAAKEAFFKAWSTSKPTNQVSLVTICAYVAVKKSGNGAPLLHVDWQNLGQKESSIPQTVHVSLTHTKKTATALVILEEN